MAPLDAERLRRNLVLYATLAMAAISLVVAAVSVAPLAMRLRDDALVTLRHDLVLKVMAASEVATRARNLAQQVTSRTVIREKLEAYNRGEIDRTALADFTRDKLADALNLSPELEGIARFAPGGVPVVAVGMALPAELGVPLGARAMTMNLAAIEGRPMLVVAAPIIGKGGAVAGTDVVLVDGASLKAIVDDARALGRTSEAALLDAATEPPRVLVSSGAPGQSGGLTGAGREGALARRAAERSASVLDEDGAFVLAAEPLPNQSWVLLLRMRANEATADVDRLLLWVMAGAAALTGLGVLGLRKMLRPLTGVFIVHHADMARQIAELEQAKAELAAKTRSLAMSNAELQEYAYAASHDLQEPVRTIIGFTQLLKRRYHAQMGPEADEFIGFIIEGAERMRRQINDLLAYARLGRAEGSAEPVALESVMAEVLESLHGIIVESGAQVVVGALPVVRGRRDPLLRMMQNLVGNAVKFVKPGEAPRVEVTAQPVGPGWVEVVVRDHGIGIEADYHERIFHMFERLNPRGDFDGSGIGLAICRKVVELHGGRLWVESRLGEGAAFHFRLPVAEETVAA